MGNLFDYIDNLWKKIEVALARGVTARLNDTRVIIHQDRTFDIEGPFKEIRVEGRRIRLFPRPD